MKNLSMVCSINYERLDYLMSVKLHFLHSHLEYFPDNLGNYSEEQGERFHQDLKVMERRYQGVWGVNMMADYCWKLKRESENRGIKRVRDPLTDRLRIKGFAINEKKCKSSAGREKVLSRRWF